MKAIIFAKFNDFILSKRDFIMRFDHLMNWKVIENLYDDSHILLHIFHSLMNTVILFKLCESFIISCMFPINAYDIDILNCIHPHMLGPFLWY